MISDLLDQLRTLTSAIRKSKAININNKSVKEAAVAVGSYYFKECRDEAQQILTDSQELSELDEDWQHLIRLAQGNNPKKSYLSREESFKQNHRPNRGRTCSRATSYTFSVDQTWLFSSGTNTDGHTGFPDPYCRSVVSTRTP